MKRVKKVEKDRDKYKENGEEAALHGQKHVYFPPQPLHLKVTIMYQNCGLLISTPDSTLQEKLSKRFQNLTEVCFQSATRAKWEFSVNVDRQTAFKFISNVSDGVEVKALREV